MNFYFSYSDDAPKNDFIVKKLVTGDDAPVNKVYKPEFVTLAPPLMNCQDEVSHFLWKSSLILKSIKIRGSLVMELYRLHI